MDNLEHIIMEMKKQLDKIVEAIVGDPTDSNNPGMIIRIDRLERSNKTLKSCLWLIGSTTVIILGNLIIKLI